MSDLFRHYRALPRSFEADSKIRIGCRPNALSGGLSGCLLEACLLKSVVSCVRVSNHVPCRRVFVAPGAASCGAGAARVGSCRLQRRHVDAVFTKFLVQSLWLPTGGNWHRAGAVGRAARIAAICSPAVGRPILRPATACRWGATILSCPGSRRIGRRAWAFVLRSASPAQA
jgi:hypothetical protein